AAARRGDAAAAAALVDALAAARPAADPLVGEHIDWALARRADADATAAAAAAAAP
ncbi:MAG: tRNA epoxyqueuosine(34) reductase QueG, partial [Rubrivivax sp.]|nr:tRNA epoxyqueuosine(34) reductase QueG [Rubrivivax sp.]